MAVHILDTRHLDRAGIIAVTAVEANDGVILFDTGPESTFLNVTAELRKVGFEARDVREVFLSHIHFDHAGAAWRFAELGATIYVHPRGAPHLIDPAKLVNSAARIYGDKMESLWGRFAPIAAEKIRILEDMDVVQVPPFEIRALATPGHASHHHIYQWEENVFGGDVAGVRLRGGPPVPPLVPPELQVESWIESIEKIRGLNPRRLFLPHFGVLDDSIPAHLDALADRIRRWTIWFRDRIRAGDNEQHLAAAFAEYVTNELRENNATNEEIRDYELADPSFMAVAAALRYWQKYHPDEVSVASGRLQ